MNREQIQINKKRAEKILNKLGVYNSYRSDLANFLNISNVKGDKRTTKRLGNILTKIDNLTFNPLRFGRRDDKELRNTFRVNLKYRKGNLSFTNDNGVVVKVVNLNYLKQAINTIFENQDEFYQQNKEVFKRNTGKRIETWSRKDRAELRRDYDTYQRQAQKNNIRETQESFIDKIINY